MTEEDRDADLKTAFNFTQADLLENTYGRLSLHQTNQLRQEAYQILYWVGGALALIGILTLLTMRATSGEMFALLACLTMPAIFAFAFTVGTTESALRARTVSKVAGMIHRAYGLSGYGFGDYDPPLDTYGPKSITPIRGGFLGDAAGAYRLVVGDREFRVTKKQYETITPGGYIAYFVPTLNKIVSIQRLEPSEAEKYATVTTAEPAPIEAPEPLSLPISTQPMPTSQRPNPDDDEQIRA
ncbi:MAG: hypothetical protein OHK0023_24830 [Anaerolineae bacterium]